ncbi:MAG: hypothetical protein IKO78_05960 [Bacilli bacterium]|nr:hypothetical protein [Bacilli bacterium]
MIKNVKKIAFLFLLLVLLWPISTNALSDKYEDKLSELVGIEKEKEKVHIYFFHGDGCPHCADEEEFLELLKERYDGKYTIYSYETWNSSKNKKLMLEAKKIMGDQENVSVPYLVIGNESFIGYSDSTGEKIELTLKNYLEIISDEEYLVNKNKENIPLLGEVDIKDVSIGLVAIVLGFIDGFNPCAMWVLLFLINMLIGMNDRKKMLIIGFVFLLTSGLMYFLFMLGITNILTYISLPLIRSIIGIVALVVGSYNIYRFFKERKEDAGCHVVDEKKRKKIFTRIKKFTQEKNMLLALGGVVILAISVNIVELACSSVFPATFAEILAVNNVTGIMKIIYLLIYTLFYMIDDLVVFTIAVATSQLSTASSKYGKYSSIVGGIIMLLVGLLLIFKPAWLMLNF